MSVIADVAGLLLSDGSFVVIGSKVAMPASSANGRCKA